MNAPDRVEAARVRAVGVYIPSRRVSNLDRIADFGIDAQFVLDKLGVRQRALKECDERASDLCVKAFADLRLQIAIDPSDVQLLCVVTQNPDYRIPYTAAVLHEKLGLGKHCMTFDVSQGCAGYTHGMAIVSAMMHSYGLEHALLFTCDPYSNIISANDKNTALLFGDAATVSYFAHSGPGYMLLDTEFGTLPGSSVCLLCEDSLTMDGRSVLMNAAREVPESIGALLRRNSLVARDINAFLLHPGSKRIIDLIRASLGLDEAKVPFEIMDYGNTVSSSIPIMLKGYLQRWSPAKLVLSGFGVGFSWASNLVDYRN